MSLEQHRNAVCNVLPVAAVGVTRPSRRRKPRMRQPEEVCWDNGQSYEVGAEWSDPGICNLKTCRAGGVVEVQRCPYPDIPEGCSLGQPLLGQTFPYCCPKAECSFRSRSSSSSSSSSTSSSDDPDKYEDLDDDDGDDGGDMTMDFTLMGVDQEEPEVKKTTDHREKNGQAETKLKQQKHVTPTQDKHNSHKSDKYRVERCTDRREITQTFRIIKDRSTHGQLTSYNELRETEPKLNINKDLKDTEESKETVKISNSNRTTISSDKNVQQTDPPKTSVIPIIVNEGALISNNQAEINKNLRCINDVNDTDKSSQNEQSLEKGNDKCTGEIKDTQRDLDQNALKIDHTKYTEENHDTTTNTDSKENVEVDMDINKMEKAEHKLSTDKNYNNNSNHDAKSVNTVQQTEKELNHKTIEKEIDHQDLRITDSIVPQTEVMSGDSVGISDELDKIHSEGNGMNKTSEPEINHRLKVCAENKVDLENGNTTGTDISEKVTVEDDHVLKLHKEPQLGVEESIKMTHTNVNLLQDVENGSTKKVYESREILINSKIVIESDKLQTDIQENENQSKDNFPTHDIKDTDNVSVKGDKIDSFIERHDSTCADKTLESLEVNHEDSTVKYSSESIKETNIDMNQYEDESVKLKEAIDNYHSVRETYAEFLKNEGKIDCWEGIEKVTQVTQEDHEKMYQELGPDREFEKVVENVMEKIKIVDEVKANEKTNCSEGLEEYYKHVNLHEEDAKFNLEPAENIIPEIERFQQFSKMAKDLLNKDGSENIIDDEFTKYKETVDEELQRNPFARFEIHSDDKLKTITEEQSEIKNEEVEESYKNSDNIENYHYESTENIVESVQTQFSEEPLQVEDHNDLIANESLTETAETFNPTTEMNEEHFHTTIDIEEDILGYNQATEPGEIDFNFAVPEDPLTHSVDASQESNPLAMMSDGPMSGSGDTDRFAPSLEAEEDEDDQDDQFAAEAHA